VIQPFIGYLLDKLPLFGYYKKSYFILCGIVTTMFYFICGSIGVLNISIYYSFILHCILDIFNLFRKIINDSLCVILNNKLKEIEEE